MVKLGTTKFRLPFLALTILPFQLQTADAAMTGAEFLQSEEGFASGYVLGLADYAMNVNKSGSSEESAEVLRFAICVAESKMNSETLYKLVVDQIHRSPEAVRQPAMSSVLKVLDQICPI